MGILFADSQGSCVSADARWCEITGLEPQQALGAGWECALHPEDRKRVRREWRTAVLDTRPFALQYRLHAADRTKFVLGQGVVERDEQQNVLGYLGLLTDLSEARRKDAALHAARERLELAIKARREGEVELSRRGEELRRLAAATPLAEERERRRIAAGLHDGVGQLLAIAKISLGKLSRSEAAGPAHSLVEIRSLVDQAICETRELTFALSSPLLHELGFETALRGLCEQLGERCDTKFHFAADSHPKPLSDDLSVTVFRATRELLFNVVKHARAQTVLVYVERLGNRIRVSMVDDGVGFDASRAGRSFSPSGGFGLFLVREGLAYAGATLEIESAPGDGTRVTLTAPLREADA